jgi:hypothetical protein
MPGHYCTLLRSQLRPLRINYTMPSIRHRPQTRPRRAAGQWQTANLSPFANITPRRYSSLGQWLISMSLTVVSPKICGGRETRRAGPRCNTMSQHDGTAPGGSSLALLYP